MTNSNPHLDGLEPAFRASVESALRACAAVGVTMRVYCGARDPWEQARYWRRSRSTARVRQEIARLLEVGAPFLASCLDDVGPQRTQPWATNAVPGLSWHQHGLAVDAVPIVDGRAAWDDMDALRTWADVATEHGMTNLGLVTGSDWYHVQADPEGSPMGRFGSWSELDGAMAARWPREAP